MNKERGFVSRTYDWQPLRDAFMTREQVPALKDLAEEFSIPYNAVGRTANDEGWAIARATRAASSLERAGVQEKMIQAAALQHVVTNRLANVVLLTTQRVETLLARIQTSDTDAKPAAEARTLQDISFTLANLANALKTSGVVALPKALMDSLTGNGKDGKPADPQTLQAALNQINITVQLAKEGKDVGEIQVQMPEKKQTVEQMIRAAEARSMHVVDTEDVL